MDAEKNELLFVRSVTKQDSAIMHETAAQQKTELSFGLNKAKVNRIIEPGQNVSVIASLVVTSLCRARNEQKTGKPIEMKKTENF
jgi:hypothetical protein